MFKGFSDSTVDFFWQIRLNNNREWFAENKPEFQRAVQEPVKALADELYEWFSQSYPELNLNLHVSRIYRDARRLYGRGPLNDHLWFSLQSDDWEEEASSPGFYFELGADGYGYGMGFFCPKAAQTARYRRAIDERPDELRALAQGLKKQSVFTLEGPEYARPKGHADDDLAVWYNKKYWSLSCDRAYDTLSYSPELTKTIEESFVPLVPMYRYLVRIFKTAE